MDQKERQKTFKETTGRARRKDKAKILQRAVTGEKIGAVRESRETRVVRNKIMRRNSEGYRNLIVWKNAVTLRKLIYSLTKKFPKSEFRRTTQMNDAARSVKQNIQEGYPKSTLEFIHTLTISQGSLKELQGDIDDCLEDNLINQDEFALADELCGKTDYLFNRLIQGLRRQNVT